MLKPLKAVYTKYTIVHGKKVRHSRRQTLYYIRRFGAPKDDIERSYFQYKCQSWDTYGLTQVLLANIVSLVLYIPYYYYYKAKAKRNVKKETRMYIAMGEFILQYMPDKYSSDCAVHDFFEGSLTGSDCKFLREIARRYPFLFYFRFKVMCRVANYSYIIRRYSPKKIFCSAEYSYTSSILTKYCESFGIDHINVQHGEKGFNIREAFCRFTGFYVWDAFYKKLFVSLGADKTDYIIKPMEVPVPEPTTNPDHYTYYLQDQQLKQLKKIKRNFELINADYTIRPHPLYSTGDVRKVFDEGHIESSETDIWTSISRAGNVVSVDSTVNYQAHLAGVSVILDDITDPEYFSKLAERKYIMLSKPHKLFSEIIKQKRN